MPDLQVKNGKIVYLNDDGTTAYELPEEGITLDAVLTAGDSSNQNIIVGNITSGDINANNINATNINGDSSTITTLNVTNLQNNVVFYRGRKNQNQAFSDVTELDVTWDVADYDTHSGRVSNLIYEIPENGLYDIRVQINAATAYVRDFIYGVQKSSDGGSNWSTIISTGNRYYGGNDDIQEGTIFTAGCLNLVAGDYLKVRAEVNTVSASTGNFQHAASQILSGTLTESVLSFFEVRKIGNLPS